MVMARNNRMRFDDKISLYFQSVAQKVKTFPSQFPSQLRYNIGTMVHETENLLQ